MPPISTSNCQPLRIKITWSTLASGLTPDNDYEFYVQADCGGSGTSNWVGPFAFYTGYCIPLGTSSETYIDNFSTSGGITNISNLDN